MERRLYFLLPDTAVARQVVDKLLVARVTEDQVHVVAQQDADTDELPEAGVSETTDIAGSAGRGAAAGAASGVVAGLAAMVFPPAGIAIGGGVVAATGLGGAGLGAWMSSMIGISQGNSKYNEYREAVDAGQVLMMVDVDAERVEQIESLIREQYADVKIERTDARKPAFP